MTKSQPLFFVLLVLALSACQGAPATVISESATQETQNQSTQSPPATLARPTAVASTAAGTVETMPAQCTVVSSEPASGQSAYPDVDPKDWVNGSSEAAVTIIEYSDFQ
jgi:protein-disulfide isomerase